MKYGFSLFVVILSTGCSNEITGSPSPDGPRPIGPRPVPETPAAEGTLFAAPNGSGTQCTEESPCSLLEVTDQAEGGDVVFLRGGTYSITENLYFRGRNSANEPTVFESYPGEWAILDGTGLTPDDEVYIRVLGEPVILRRFEVKSMSKMGLAVRTSDNLLEGLVVHHNLLSGIHIHESYETPTSNRNLVRDCIVHDNSGAGIMDQEYNDGGNSDGISISSGFDNRVENCLIYGNSDDGLDTWRSQDTYVGYTIVHSSGIANGNGQGFKAGGQPPAQGTTIEHSISYNNKAVGFDYNSGVNVTFSNVTSWGNARGFWTGDTTEVRNSIATEELDIGGDVQTEVNNSWQRMGAPAFISTDPNSDNFLVPAPDSGFEDIGAYANREE